MKEIIEIGIYADWQRKPFPEKIDTALRILGIDGGQPATNAQKREEICRILGKIR